MDAGDGPAYGWWALVLFNGFPLTIYLLSGHREEREVVAELGDAWRAYAKKTPRWIPRVV